MALGVLPQRDSALFSYFQCSVFRLSSILHLHKHGQAAGALASPPLCLCNSKTAASNLATAREGGAWAADADLEASAETRRCRPGPWTAPQCT